MKTGADPTVSGTRVGAYATSMRGTRSLGRADGSLELPLVSGSVTGRADGGDVLTAKLRFPAHLAPTSEWSPLAPMGQRLHVVARYQQGSTVWDVPVAWFHVRKTTISDGGVDVDAVGLEYLLEQDPIVYPTSPAVGATLLGEARRLAGCPVVLDAGVEDVVVDANLSWGFSRWKALRDLGDAYGVRFAFRDDQVLHAIPWERDSRKPDVSLSADRCVVEVDDTREWSVYNRVTVVAKSSDKGAQGLSYTASLGGVYAPEWYGVRRKRIEVESAYTLDVIQATAEREIRQHELTGRVVKVETVPDARIELGDVVGVERKTGEWITGKVTGFNLPLGASGAMRLDLEELLW